MGGSLNMFTGSERQPLASALLRNIWFSRRFSNTVNFLVFICFQLVGFKLLHKVARKDSYLPFLTFLHEHKCNLNAQTWRLQQTAVGIAIRLEQVGVLKFLVKNGADVNMYSNPERHTLPLYDAVQTRNIEILQTLLSAKTINVNPIEEWPSRWILVHCINLFPDGVESLLRAGADPNVSGRYGGTPLAASAISKNTEMVKLLIQYGASVNFEDSMTQAPLQHSVIAGEQKHVIHTL